MSKSESKLLSLYQGRVQPEWIDYNGHMNVAFYVLAFDHATDALLDHIGMTGQYRAEEQGSIFTLELHVNYLQELKLDDPIRCDTQLLDYDGKRIHYFHYMYHAQEDYLAATTEMIVMHMDMRSRRGAPMPEFIQDKLRTILSEHSQLARPAQAGSVIGIRRK